MVDEDTNKDKNKEKGKSGKVILGIAVGNGEMKSQMNTVGAGASELSFSIAMLEQMKRDLLKEFEKITKKQGGK